jgi:hypothetical protein
MRFIGLSVSTPAGLKDVLCQLLQISSKSAGGLFIPLSAARRTVFVAYVA